MDQDQITKIEGLTPWPSSPAEKRRILEWLVKFGQQDIEELTPLEKETLALEVNWWLRFFGVNIQGNPPDFQLPPRNSMEYWEKVGDFQKKILGQIRAVLPKEGDREIRLHNASISYRIDSSEESFRLIITPSLTNFANMFRFEFYRLLEGLPSTTILECDSCKRLFVNPARRKKRFCSTKCMWRFNSEKRRKADPAKYRKKMREIMKNRYIERKAEERGVAVDKVKIQKKRSKMKGGK